MASMEFEQIGGMKLIQQVLQTSQAVVGQKVLDVSQCTRTLLHYFLQSPLLATYILISAHPCLHVDTHIHNTVHVHVHVQCVGVILL